VGKIETARWTDNDKNVYYCEACQRFHYLYSNIGKRHEKFARKKKKKEVKYEVRMGEIKPFIGDIEEF